jgi:hypothetical protein
MAGRSQGKISPGLAEQLESVNHSEPIEVIVELVPPPATPVTGSRAERIGALRENFDRTLASVAGRMGATGGEILDSAWINSTIRALLTRDQIQNLETNELVRHIDSPRALSADA